MLDEQSVEITQLRRQVDWFQRQIFGQINERRIDVPASAQGSLGQVFSAIPEAQQRVNRAGLSCMLEAFDKHRLRGTNSPVRGVTANSCATCIVELRPTSCTGSRAGFRLAGFAYRLRGRPVKSCRN